MRTKTLFMLFACFFLACSGVQAQSKFGKFLKKVDKALDGANQKLEDVNNAMKGSTFTTAENGVTKIVSPTSDLAIEFVKCYDEGHDVVIQLKITNTTDKDMGMNWGCGTGYDESGNTYGFGDREFILAGKEVSPLGVGIPSGIPLKASIRLKDVDENATTIKKLVINTYQVEGIEVRNIPITRDQASLSGSSADGVSVLSPKRTLQLVYKGNLIEGNNTLLVNFTLTNTSEEDISLHHGGGSAWDDEGNMYEFGNDELTISGKGVGPLGVPVPAGIPVKGTIILNGVSKSASVIKLIKFGVYKISGFEIKNVPINWEE